MTNKKPKVAAPSPLEQTFLRLWRVLPQSRGLEIEAHEYEFADSIKRKWRFDFAWPSIRLAVELEGTTRKGSRHQRTKGFVADCHKYNFAQVTGWVLLRYTRKDLTQRPVQVIDEVVATVRRLKTQSAKR